MGKVILIESEAGDVETVNDLFREFKPVINQIASNLNEMCIVVRKTEKIADEANQRSKNNQWMIAGLISGITLITVTVINLIFGG